MEANLESVFKKNIFVTKRKYTGEVLLNYRNRYYSLDAKSEFIWDSIDGVNKWSDIIRKMAETFSLKIDECISILLIYYVIFTENELITNINLR